MVCEFACYYDSDSPIGKAYITHYLLSFFFPTELASLHSTYTNTTKQK